VTSRDGVRGTVAPMTTLTLPELRRALGRALLAAPLVVGCGSRSAPEQARPAAADAAAAAELADATGSRAAPDAASPDAAAPDAAVLLARCRHGELRITGCGGAEVVLEDHPAACGLPETGEIAEARCGEYCAGFDTRGCRVSSNRDGAPIVYCDAAKPCYGRLPSDGRLPRARHGDGVVEHLALARQMEAQSVAAFRELEADLARWGAPASLGAACRRAARDEARHAATMTRLLRDRGVAAGPVERPTAAGFASLRALALHNEREGVVGETWGALLALHQAAHAIDDDVRAAMAGIAEEETAHAALSLAIAAWARTQLGDDDVRSLDRERRAAFAHLRETRGLRPDAAAADRLGWPTPAASDAMLAALAPILAASHTLDT
jgi:hypothetical protein